MPEFEEENINASQSQHYTPSTDASKKPRSRRRSGGFKTEVAPLSNDKIGEVSAADALKKEKLSGESSSPSEAGAERSERPARREPRERKPREPRRETHPQPSPETRAAIARVEARLNERRANREARRAKHDKNRPAKAEPSSPAKRKSSQKQVAKPSGGSLLAAISGFFGKLFGNEPKPAPAKNGHRSGQGRSGRPKGKSGQRGDSNRGRGGRGGNRGGQGRKRGGQGPRRSPRRSKEEKVDSE